MLNDESKRAGSVTTSDFSRILTLLRKERGLSQKQVAIDLKVSQALLSHYEKGVRECGLSFVVRAADYYGVSCDYLLGRTPQRTGAVISVNELPGDGTAKTDTAEGSTLEYNRRILVNSLNIVFGILKKINSESLTMHISNYLSAAVYKAFRVLYTANPKNSQGIFSIDKRPARATVESTMAMAEAKSRYILSGENIDDDEGVKKEALPTMTTESLMEDYPQSASALFDLIKNTEKAAKNVR